MTEIAELPEVGVLGYECSLILRDSWKVTDDTLDRLLVAMIESLESNDACKIRIHGDQRKGSFEVEFEVATPDDSPFDGPRHAFSLTIQALNAARLSAPDWPDDNVVDGAIGTVTVKKFGETD